VKYDLLDEDGNRWPPKAVIQIASEIATGKPLPRTDFSGHQINDRLAELGFKILPKPGITASTITVDDLKPGMIISNEDIGSAFKVGNSGGMRWSSTRNCLVLVADHTKALYDDRWDNGILHYTGIGTTGPGVDRPESKIGRTGANWNSGSLIRGFGAAPIYLRWPRQPSGASRN
jgi:hypothetical protein